MSVHLAARDLASQRGRTTVLSLNRQRGVALLLAVFAVMILTAVGIGLMFLSDTETSINGSYRDEQLSYYAAKAGLEEVRDRMDPNSSVSITAKLPISLPGAANGVLYILNPNNGETVTPWTPGSTYFDDEICQEVNCSGGQVPPTGGWYITPALRAASSYAANPVLPYKWVRITLKTNQSSWGTVRTNYVNGSNNSTSANYQVCWNGTNEFASSTGCADPNRPVYLVTSLAVTPSGTRRMIQFEMTNDTLNLTFPAALTLDGTGDSMSGANSSPYNMDGSDHAGCGGLAGTTLKAAIGVPDTPDVATVTGDIPPNRRSSYTGSGAAPDVENISSSLPASLQSVSALEGLLAKIKSNVTQPVLTGSVSSLSNPGTPSLPQIIFIDGNFSPSGTQTGYGILVVTGTFSPGGNFGWQGIVLVVGQGIVVGNGGGNNQYNGAFFVAKTRDASGNLLPSLGAATFNFSGGGGNGIYYSSGCVANANHLPDYRVLAVHELMR